MILSGTGQPGRATPVPLSTQREEMGGWHWANAH